MKQNFCDSHVHLTCEDLLPDVKLLIQRAKEANVLQMVNICTDKNSLLAGIELQKEEKGIYNAGATPPHDVLEKGEIDFPIFEQYARERMLVAIGETGLDYYYEHSPKQTQKKFLIQYLKLAKELDLPVIFHCRDAFNDLFEITKEHYKIKDHYLPAILHCFTGNEFEVAEAVSRGWYISFSGIITFKKSVSLREVVKKVPLKQLLIETDAPYLAPQTKRGKRNEPSFLPEIASTIAAEKGLQLIDVIHATQQNAEKVFSLK